MRGSTQELPRSPRPEEGRRVSYRRVDAASDPRARQLGLERRRQNGKGKAWKRNLLPSVPSNGLLGAALAVRAVLPLTN